MATVAKSELVHFEELLQRASPPEGPMLYKRELLVWVLLHGKRVIDSLRTSMNLLEEQKLLYADLHNKYRRLIQENQELLFDLAKAPSSD